MIEFHQVNKWYGSYHALRDITLHRNQKKFIYALYEHAKTKMEES
ncbi:hypothetical protein [Kyrpidia spormannii]|nr:hypothetical protein [Kyrpidia spormannii]